VRNLAELSCIHLIKVRRLHRNCASCNLESKLNSSYHSPFPLSLKLKVFYSSMSGKNIRVKITLQSKSGPVWEDAVLERSPGARKIMVQIPKSADVLDLKTKITEVFRKKNLPNLQQLCKTDAEMEALLRGHGIASIDDVKINQITNHEGYEIDDDGKIQDYFHSYDEEFECTAEVDLYATRLQDDCSVCCVIS